MRMWMIDPKLLCQQHLLGEHVEIHMMAGAARRGKSLDGYLDGLLEPQSARRRHQDLVREMKRRGFKHKSSLPKFKTKAGKKISLDLSVRDLCKRCPDCRARFHLAYIKRFSLVDV